MGKSGAYLILAAAAVLEVAGDAIIRKGLRGGGLVVVGLGFGVLGSYGVVVNLLGFDFSRLLGAYVGVFGVVSVLIGRLVFRESVPFSTWAGLSLVLLGSLVIHLGHSR
ncbi:MAG TPA: hypothetical protein VMK12_07355 [Anaeromyxobacteraceae bacterium]|nr:hypothetical protein [Anaeromyxobacteraceae bacterium]